MINHINGKLVEKASTYVVIECHGVGYEINISLNTYAKIGDEEALKLHTFLQIKEDAHTLWGFADKKEKALFKLLISVSGIGGNIARTMLSTLTPEETMNAILADDVATIKAVKGIGPKTAQKMIIELRDKVQQIHQFDDSKLPLENTSSVKDEAIAALETLGFQRKAIQKVVDAIVKVDPTLAVENILKQALKKL